MSCLKGILKVVGFVVLAIFVILVAPGLPPDVELTEFHVKPPQPLFSQFPPYNNTVLNEAEVYYESPSAGVESMVVLSDSEIITGDMSGRLFKVTGKQKAVNITQLKFPCRPFPPLEISSSGGDSCSWPLGMRLDKDDGSLLVMDLFGGLVKVNLKTGSYHVLVPYSKIEGKYGINPEDVVASSDGSIYFTDGSTGESFFEEFFYGPSGRLLKYDPKTKTTQVLLDDLYFSNGIAISDEEEFLLISESHRAGVRRYYLRGEKKGQSDMFIEGLPGYPDNIRENGKGGFYVPLFCPWNDEFSVGHERYTPYRLVRKLILRTHHLLVNALALLNKVFLGNTYVATVAKRAYEFRLLLNHFDGAPKIATIVELSQAGEVLNVFKGTSGNIHILSQISLGEKFAYLASPMNNKLWRIRREALSNPSAQ